MGQDQVSGGVSVYHVYMDWTKISRDLGMGLGFEVGRATHPLVTKYLYKFYSLPWKTNFILQREITKPLPDQIIYGSTTELVNLYLLLYCIETASLLPLAILWLAMGKA